MFKQFRKAVSHGRTGTIPLPRESTLLKVELHLQAQAQCLSSTLLTSTTQATILTPSLTSSAFFTHTIMAHVPGLAQGRDVQEQRIDPRFLSGRHVWQLEPVSGLSFRDTVEQNTTPRVDMANYKLISAVNSQKAKNLFSGLANTPTLFRIPHALRCDRTFARDNEEALYLDAMDNYLRQQAAPMTVNDMPILKRPLQNRLFCAFARKPGYLSELFERRRLKLWLPSDAPENKELGEPALADLYPKIEEWLDLIYQPTCLPVPLPFVVYYFHKELREAQMNPELGNSERARRLFISLQMEYYILVMATWWNEAFHGGRMHVMKKTTIDVLQKYCSAITDIAGKPGQVILEHMRIASELPNHWHNWMCYRDRSMEPSVFIWSRRGYGGLDPFAQKGVRIYCDRLTRKITSTRYGSNLFKRVSAMDQRLSAPYLDEIEGLLGVVRDQEWDAHGSLRVSDLLHHLLSLYRKTHQRASVVTGDNDAIRRELGFLKDEIRRKDDKIRDKEERLDDALRRIHGDNRYIDELQARIRDLRAEVDDRRRDRSAALRSANRPSDIARVTPASISNPCAEGPSGAPSQHAPGTPRSPQYNPYCKTPEMGAVGSSSNTVMLSRSQHCRVPRSLPGTPRNTTLNSHITDTVNKGDGQNREGNVELRTERSGK